MIRTFITISEIQFKELLRDRMFKYTILIQPIIFTLLFNFMYPKNTPLLGNRIIISSILMSLWSSLCISSISNIRKERQFGTLEYISSTPTSFMFIIITRTFANILINGISVFICYFVSKFCLNTDIQIYAPFPFLISIFITIITFISLSILLGSFFTAGRDTVAYINALEYPIYIVCGLSFPISNLPHFLQSFSYIFPPTYGVLAINTSLGDFDKQIFIYWLLGLLISALYILLAMKVLNLTIFSMKKNNTGGLI